MSAVEREHAIATAIARATGEPYAVIARTAQCTGGCIHHSMIVTLADERRYFVKWNHASGDMFAQEAFGLSAIRQVGCIATPEVLTAESLAGSADCLILEAIEPGEPRRDFWARFGSQLAELHRRGTASNFGWASDNYIGSTVQKNESRASWSEFFRECRLGYQLRLARQAGHGSVELFRLAQRVLNRLDELLGHGDEQPSLLHGDLWSGNFLVDQRGEPVLIDPAVYYGAREAELAMPLLFGGFPQEFIAAYDEAWPLPDGWRERVQIYQLYHLLNHLNLFGSGYLDSCLEIVRRFGS